METGHKSKLYRSRKDRIIAGICGGLAEHFGWDPLLVRLVFILLALVNGLGTILYVILWIVVPHNPNEEENTDQKEKAREFVEQAGEKIKEVAHELGKEVKGFGEGVKATAEEIKAKRETRRARRRNIIGAFFVVLGIVLLADALVPMPFLTARIFWPVILILLGILFIARNVKK